MSYSTDINLFWELLEIDNAVLHLDNDMCYISYNDEEHQSFDFTPEDLVFMFAERLDIGIEVV